MFLTDSLSFDFITVTGTTIIVLIACIKWIYSYWARMGLETPQTIFPFGSVWDSVKRKVTLGEDIARIYSEMKARGLKHAGMFLFHVPVYIPINPELLKHIMQNDFGHFVDRGAYSNEKVDPLSAHLFSLEGTKWRNLRAKLSPTFTSGQMKMMFPLVVQTSEELISVLHTYGPEDAVEFKDILARLTTDIIGTCAFGLDCNSLKDPDTEFRRQGKQFFIVSNIQLAKQFAIFMFPDAMKYFGVKFTEDNMTKFFMGVVKDTVKHREDNNVTRKDFMQLLIHLKNDGTTTSDEADSKLTINEVAAQAFIFFLAGFETSSATMSFCLYELAMNEDVQDKLRNEINRVLSKHNGVFTYEGMMEMHYMDNVINETLRKYPPIPTLFRVCTKDYNVPDTNISLVKGTRVFISVLGLQHDPEYYPNPDVFDPTRFDSENKRERHPFTFLPFGEGPRVCIGLRFGIMQAKVGLTILLKNYKFKLNPLTQVPLKLDPTGFLSAPQGGIWMNIEKIV